jgi:serine phosphatase RsbU (regulator of sigma subunit)
MLTGSDRRPGGPPGAAEVIRTGHSERYEIITDEMLVAGARDEQHLRIARDLGLRSAMVVPLAARGRNFGALSLFRTTGARSYQSADLEVAEDLGRRAGLAIDNAILYGRAQDAASQLQRAVLPTELAALTGEQIATYCRAGGDADVGGDFYDAVPLGSGRTALIIGDVMGHGIEAAAAMAQMRAAIRAYLSIDPSPIAVVSNLDQMFTRLAIGQLVSLVYAIYDARTRELRVLNAGHYPPLLIDRKGASRFLSTEPQLPIGVGGDVRSDDLHHLSEGDTLLLYTDGLIERRGEVIDDGLARLAAAATHLPDTALDEGISNLIAELSENSVDDDVTALALRTRALLTWATPVPPHFRGELPEPAGGEPPTLVCGRR